MIQGGFSKKAQNEGDFTFKHSCPDCERIVSTVSLCHFIEMQYLNYMAHTCRQPNDALTKRVLFVQLNASIIETDWCRISEILNVSKFEAQMAMQNKAELTSLMKKNLNFKVALDSRVTETHHGGQ